MKNVFKTAPNAKSDAKKSEEKGNTAEVSRFAEIRDERLGGGNKDAWKKTEPELVNPDLPNIPNIPNVPATDLDIAQDGKGAKVTETPVAQTQPKEAEILPTQTQRANLAAGRGANENADGSMNGEGLAEAPKSGEVTQEDVNTSAVIEELVEAKGKKEGITVTKK